VQRLGWSRATPLFYGQEMTMIGLCEKADWTWTARIFLIAFTGILDECKTGLRANGE
jgi:hypothetical protein